MSNLSEMVSRRKRSLPKLAGVTKKKEKPRKNTDISPREIQRFKNLEIERSNEGDFTQSQIKEVDKEIFEAVDYYYKILKNDRYHAVLWSGNDQLLTGADLTKRVGMRIHYTRDGSKIGYGISGPRGFEVWVNPAGKPHLDDMTAPAFVVIHELHHVYGSRTEFDIGTEAAYLGYLFSRHFNDPRYANDLRFHTKVKVTTLMTYGVEKNHNLLAMCEFLYSEYKTKYLSILKKEGFKPSYINQFVHDILQQ